MVEVVHATVIKQDMAVKIRATRECTDESGQMRKAGEEWLVRKAGAYLPAVDEEVIESIEALVCTWYNGTWNVLAHCLHTSSTSRIQNTIQVF